MPLCVVQPNTVNTGTHNYFPDGAKLFGFNAKQLVLAYNGLNHYASTKQIPLPKDFQSYHLGKVDALLTQAESAARVLVSDVGVEEMLPVLTSVREAITKYEGIRQQMKGTD